MPKARHASLVLAVLLLVGCVSARPPAPAPTNPADAAAVRIYNGLFATLDGSATLYAGINDGVRLAHEAGVLSDEQLDRISPKLVAASRLLTEAKMAVDTYLAAVEAGQGAVSPVAKARLAIDAVTALLGIAQELGVAP